MKATAAAGNCGRSGYSTYELSGARWMLAALLVLFFFLRSLCFAAESRPAKNVLVLYSFTKRDSFSALEPLKSTLRSRFPGPVHIYVEYLESKRFGVAGYAESLGETFRHAYAEKRFDLVVAGGYPAFQFVTKSRDGLFPRVPIVFIDVAPGRLQGQMPRPGVTGVTTTSDIRGSIELALRLQPDTRNVAITAGDSDFEVYWLKVFRTEFRAHENRVKLIDLSGVPTEQLLQKVFALPAHTIVFFNLVPEEASQSVLSTLDVLAAIGQRLPTYCFHNYCFDHGGIGGSYPNGPEQGVKGGEVSARILSGEKPENIPVVGDSGAKPMVDWRQLRRWNIPESALPPGSIILYRPPTVWKRYEKLIVLGLLLIVLQALLIAGLLWQRARKRKTEASLRESEKRFQVMADTAPSLIWMCDQNGKVTYQSEKRIAFTGGPPEAGLGDGWTAYVHPDDRKSVLEANSSALQRQEGFSKEYRLRRGDGVYRWMFDIASTRFDAHGSFSGFIGSSIDVTDQKLAQEALEKLGGRLIEAQERERSRIARELHDDICQRLALLSMELEQADQSSNDSGALANTQFGELRKNCADIAADVQALSHALHSSKLDYLGVVAALRSFCKEFSKQQNVEVEFTNDNVSNHLPRDISLCLFRVAQEAMHNAAKHSGMSRFAVRLSDAADDIRLEVRDWGVGFDVEEAMKDSGLGLVSMRERIHLVNGILSIESKPNEGTRIVARVPRVANSGAASVAAAGSDGLH